MINEATMEKMKGMKLLGMAQAFENLLKTQAKLTLDEVAAYLVDAEYDDRFNRKLESLIRKGRFRYQSCMEGLDFRPDRNLDKNLMMRLTNCDWIKKKQNLIISGTTGSGKSYIASALGNQACRHGYKTLYYSCKKLFDRLRIAKAEGSYSKEIGRIQHQDLLILDDFGIEILDQFSRMSLFEIIEDRQGEKSTIIISQLPLKKWFDVIGDPTIADAICDRIVHSAITIDLKAVDSMRKVLAKNAG
ncbi:MAG: IS21-like element helper ATPase IstB [Brevinematales bacterium]|jgi:DNA replication protein DnaC